MIKPIPPFLIYLIGALFVPLLVGKAKKALLLIIPILAYIDLLLMPHGNYWKIKFLDYELIFGQVDKLSMVFAYVFVIISFAALLYALHVDDDVQHFSALYYAGSSLGVAFAGDLFTLYLFWEIMAVASVFIIWCQRDKEAIGAGFRYLLVHLFGGCALLAGIVIYAIKTGSIAFSGPLVKCGLGFWLILIGFILNAAVPPLHPWLPDAYPRASVTGAIFLTAYTTKSAVYTLLRAFPGVEVLAYLGAIMTVYGVVWAIMENDIRRLLAYHIVSQVGYMVGGVGIGTELSMNGSAAHAFCHILYKALLFMGAGAVIYQTGMRKMSDLTGRDLYKKIPLSLIFYMVGAFSISAVPLFNGFICKPMIVTAAEETHMLAVFFLMHTASIGTWLCVGLKLPYYTWFGKRRPELEEIEIKKLPWNMIAGMAFLSFLCIFMGVYPDILYRVLPYPVEYHPYTPMHVIGSLQMLLMTVVGVWILLKRLEPHAVINLDTDWFYRKGAILFVKFCYGLSAIRTILQKLAMDFVDGVIVTSKNPVYVIESIFSSKTTRLEPYDANTYRTAVGIGVMFSLIFFAIVCFIFFHHLLQLLVK